jgi:hypothetical protein
MTLPEPLRQLGTTIANLAMKRGDCAEDVPESPKQTVLR